MIKNLEKVVEDYILSPIEKIKYPKYFGKNPPLPEELKELETAVNLPIKEPKIIKSTIPLTPEEKHLEEVIKKLKKENLIKKTIPEIEILDPYEIKFYESIPDELGLKPLAEDDMKRINEFFRINQDLAEYLGTDTVSLYTFYGVGASILTGTFLILLLAGIKEDNKNIKIHP